MDQKRRTDEIEKRVRSAHDMETEKKIIQDIEEDEGVVNNTILKIAAEDVDVSMHETSMLEAEKEKKQESFYSDLIYTLLNTRMNEMEARLSWSDIIAHKAEMKNAMGRNVGIRVAALDYFQNVLKKVDDVRIIDQSHYIETKRLVVTDGLTGLMNHRYFYEKRDILLRRYNRGLVKNVGLMVLDLDYFKQYNDSNGHIAGDIVLIETAKILRECAGESNDAFRYGGEEFTVLVPDTTLKKLTKLADKIRKKVEETDFVNEAVLPGRGQTISIGLTIYPDICKDVRHFIENADQALYMAKKLGRNRVEVEEE